MVRTSPAGRAEVLLVHRPRRADWTLPKGKREGSETFEECALREVLEETGHRCELGIELASTTHRSPGGRLKIVRYWSMRPTGGVFRPNREVDEIRWVCVSQVGELLTYERDRRVVAGLTAVSLASM